MPKGHETISLLQQQTSNKTSPTSSQFTFTFDSQASGSVPWPGSEASSPHIANQRVTMQAGHNDSYYGTNARSMQNGRAPGSQTGSNSTADVPRKGSPSTNAPPTKHKRRGNPLLLAAKQRRQDQSYKNYHQPPKPEEAWICEFCEYERIFGRPPEALIRQYEIKDRNRRREEADRRRLLEKAKMQSRKGKKPSKRPTKQNPATNGRSPAQPAGHEAPPMDQVPSQETHSEDFDEDDYDENDVHDNYPAVVPGEAFEPNVSLETAGTVGDKTRDSRSAVV